jgi:prolyl 4-hydroxylase
MAAIRMDESWRGWIQLNLSRGCTVQSMLKVMLDKGFDAEEAKRALMEEGTQARKRGALLHAQALPQLPRLPATASFSVAKRKIQVLARLNSPYAAVLSGVLTRSECGQLVELARHKGLVTSRVVDRETGQHVPNDGRTSSGVYFLRAETPLIASIEARLASMTGWPVTHAEGLQVLCYEPGQQYKAHFDWFDPALSGSKAALAKGGQRVGTTVMYLSPADEGGGTAFPKTGLEVFPPQGGAVFFGDVDLFGQPDPMSLHAGTPVVAGTKIVATYWQREREYG